MELQSLRGKTAAVLQISTNSYFTSAPDLEKKHVSQSNNASPLVLQNTSLVLHISPRSHLASCVSRVSSFEHSLHKNYTGDNSKLHDTGFNPYYLFTGCVKIAPDYVIVIESETNKELVVVVNRAKKKSDRRKRTRIKQVIARRARIERPRSADSKGEKRYLVMAAEFGWRCDEKEEVEVIRSMISRSSFIGEDSGKQKRQHARNFDER